MRAFLLLSVAFCVPLGGCFAPLWLLLFSLVCCFCCFFFCGVPRPLNRLKRTQGTPKASPKRQNFACVPAPPEFELFFVCVCVFLFFCFRFYGLWCNVLLLLVDFCVQFSLFFVLYLLCVVLGTLNFKYKIQNTQTTTIFSAGFPGAGSVRGGARADPVLARGRSSTARIGFSHPKGPLGTPRFPGTPEPPRKRQGNNTEQRQLCRYCT